MATYYNEFDTTVGQIIVDLATNILGSSDWARVYSAPSAIATVNANASAGATSITVSSGHTVTANQIIAIDSAGSGLREFRKVTSTTSTSLTLATATLYAHNTSVSIYPANEILKCTTTRGADMIIDLADGEQLNDRIQPAFWRLHSSNVGTDKSARWMFWRNSTSTVTVSTPLHVTVSAGKEHLFVMIEGPRANETGAQSTTYGSSKTYLFANDMVPYNSGDTVAQIYIGGNIVNTYNMAQTQNNADGHLTRNYANTFSWDAARLGTITMPIAYAYAAGQNSYNGTVNLNHQSVIDNKFYLFPYVVCSNGDGPRGRLASFFNAGFSMMNNGDYVSPSPVGSKITYNSILYKLIAVDRGNGTSYESWGQFGVAWTGVNVADTFFSNVVAVPCT